MAHTLIQILAGNGTSQLYMNKFETPQGAFGEWKMSLWYNSVHTLHTLHTFTLQYVGLPGG